MGTAAMLENIGNAVPMNRLGRNFGGRI